MFWCTISHQQILRDPQYYFSKMLPNNHSHSSEWRWVYRIQRVISGNLKFASLYILLFSFSDFVIDKWEGVSFSSSISSSQCYLNLRGNISILFSLFNLIFFIALRWVCDIEFCSSQKLNVGVHNLIQVYLYCLLLIIESGEHITSFFL